MYEYIYVCAFLCMYVYVARLNIPKAGVNNVPNAGVNKITKAGVDVISKAGMKGLIRRARFTTYGLGK